MPANPAEISPAGQGIVRAALAGKAAGDLKKAFGGDLRVVRDRHQLHQRIVVGDELALGDREAAEPRVSHEVAREPIDSVRCRNEGLVLFGDVVI